MMEMSSPVAWWLQVGTCTHVHPDPFRDVYPRLALPAGLQEMSEGWAPIGVAVSWARIHFRCSTAADAKPVPVFVLLQLSIAPSLLVSHNDGKCPSHETPLRYISRPTHQQLLISPSKTLNVKPRAAELLLLYLRESHYPVLSPKILQLVLQHNPFSSPSP